MVEFSYTIKDEIGIHARPAGVLSKLAKGYESTVTVIKGDKSADMTKLMKLMGLGVVHGDTITVKVEGADEEACAQAIKESIEANL